MRNIGTACALFTLLLLAGCSGGKEGAETPQDHGAEISQKSPETIDAKPLRKEFVIMRELVRQHELQQGNDKRIEAVERALQEKFPALPDKGETDEERKIYREADRLLKSLQKH